MPLWAWLLLFALEGAILLVYFREELRLRAFQHRFALHPEGKGFRGTVAEDVLASGDGRPCKP